MRAVLSILLLGLSLNAQALQVRDAYEANSLCSGAFSCSGETYQKLFPSRPYIQQPSSPNPVVGNCGQLPRGLDYGARRLPLTCGGGSDQRLRERIAHTQQELDHNMAYLDVNNREAAQKVLLKKDYGWAHNIKFNVTENWTYKKKVGDFVDCRNYPSYSEGGEPESYQTTCYRTGRKETVIRRVIRKRKYCARATPPPRVETDSSSSSSTHSSGTTVNGGTYNSGSTFNSGSTGSHNSGNSSRSYERQEPRQQPRQDNIKRGRDEDRGSIERRFDRGGSKPSGGSKKRSEYNELTRGNRLPARNLRRIGEDEQISQESTPTWGCDEWKIETVKDRDEEVQVDADDLSYSCTQVRSKFCTWFEESEPQSQSCPEQKTATINMKFKTPDNWKPGGDSRYDDMLPNGFDLLMGESEIITLDIKGGIDLSPKVDIKNGQKSREKPWYKYNDNWSPSVASCRYQDQVFNLELTPTERIVQSAPNLLKIPLDENGKEKAFEGLDDQGRPKSLQLQNPGRFMVLDRTNLSRTMGKDVDASKVDMKKDPALQFAGISRKSFESTRFWMRLVWFDGEMKDRDGKINERNKVKVSLGRPYSINQAGPEAENLTISLAAEGGMDKFYKQALPLEEYLGFLGGNVALDPKVKYFIEVKMAQTNFDGIYLSGVKGITDLSEQEKALLGKDAYSESIYIPLDSSTSKRGIWDWYRNMRARRMWRPL